MWTPEYFNEKTADMPINSSFQLSVVNRWTNFVEWLTPTGMVVLLGRYNRLLLKLYESGGTEITREARLMLRFKKSSDRLWKEVSVLGEYGNWYDPAWLDQLNSDATNAEKIDLGYPFVLVYPGESLALAIYSTSQTLPSTPYEQTKLKLPYFYMDKEKFDALKRVKGLRLPDFVKTGDLIQ